VLRPGVCVQIGLGKMCALKTVFKRYVDFCNETAAKNDQAYRGVKVGDLEFIHCTVLSGEDTPENAALMKNDRISVQKESSHERQLEESARKEFCESDKVYFEQLRLLLLPTHAAFLSSSKPLLATVKHQPRVEPALTKYSDVVLCCEAQLHPKQVGMFQFQGGYGRIGSRCIENHNKNNNNGLIRCHSYLVSKRCPWLGNLIKTARITNENERKLKQKLQEQQNARQSVVTVPEMNENIIQQQQEPKSANFEDNADTNRQQQDGIDNPPQLDQWISQGSNEFDEYEIEVLHHNVDNNNNVGNNSNNRRQGEERDDNVLGALDEKSPAVQIDASDDDDELVGQNQFRSTEHKQMKHPKEQNLVNAPDKNNEFDEVLLSAQGDVRSEISSAYPNLLWVPIKDHSSEAVSLLLEYCYTNRVVALGFDAFEQSCRTRPPNKSDRRHDEWVGTTGMSPVSPFSSKESGNPTITYEVAVAGIALAEEAGMHRLSLMCEIAASQLISTINIAIDALRKCEEYNQLYKNALPRVRQAATYEIFGSRNSIDTVLMPALVSEETNKLLVPPLLTGVMEAIAESNKNSSNNHASGQSSKSRKKPSLGSTGTSHHHHHQHHHDSYSSGNVSEFQSDIDEFLKKVDVEDFTERERERYKRRYETDAALYNHIASVSSSNKRQRSSVTTLNRMLLSDVNEGAAAGANRGNYLANGLIHDLNDPSIGSMDASDVLRNMSLKRMAAHCHHQLLAVQGSSGNNDHTTTRFAASAAAVGSISTRFRETTTSTTTTSTSTTTTTTNKKKEGDSRSNLNNKNHRSL
jgi:hypothetical protein